MADIITEMNLRWLGDIGRIILRNLIDLFMRQSLSFRQTAASCLLYCNKHFNIAAFQIRSSDILGRNISLCYALMSENSQQQGNMLNELEKK